MPEQQPSMWVEIEGSPKTTIGPGNLFTVARSWRCPLNTGPAAALAAGYSLGAQVTYLERQLYVTRINPRNDNGYDVVDITFAMGYDEWTIEGATDSAMARDATSLVDGTPYSESWGIRNDEVVLQPSMFLLWRRCLAPFGIIRLPSTREEALTHANLYSGTGLGGGAVTEPASDAPVLGETLGASNSNGKDFLCAEIFLEEVEGLVFRVARFKWSKKVWHSPPYLTGPEPT